MTRASRYAPGVHEATYRILPDRQYDLECESVEYFDGWTCCRERSETAPGCDTKLVKHDGRHTADPDKVAAVKLRCEHTLMLFVAARSMRDVDGLTLFASSKAARVLPRLPSEVWQHIMHFIPRPPESQ